MAEPNLNHLTGHDPSRPPLFQRSWTGSIRSAPQCWMRPDTTSIESA
jgi:hypothetical protein